MVHAEINDFVRNCEVLFPLLYDDEKDIFVRLLQAQANSDIVRGAALVVAMINKLKKYGIDLKIVVSDFSWTTLRSKLIFSLMQKKNYLYPKTTETQNCSPCYDWPWIRCTRQTETALGLLYQESGQEKDSSCQQKG